MNSGDRIGGKYRLSRQLGTGAMGVVWEALNETASKRVAIKLINRPTPDLRHRLLREARACGSISNRNVVEIYDVGETDEGEPFLVMQLLSGETLAELLKRQRRLAQGMAARIGRDIARGLAAAHAAKVIHRDLKPANVFLHQEQGTEGSIVKVLDFGVAKSLDAGQSLVTVVGGAVGSPAYMSPEQVRAARDLDPRTDVWSLGVVLFEILAGVRPFQCNGQELLTALLVGPIPRVSERVRYVDRGLDDLVARCLERDRERRMASAAEVASQLEEYVGPNEGSRVYVGLAEKALMQSSPDPGVAAASEAETAVPQPAQGDLRRGYLRVPGMGAPVQAPAVFEMPASALDVTAPLPPMPAPKVGKHGTIQMASSVQPAMGPRGTALMIDSNAVRAEAARSGSERDAPPASGPEPGSGMAPKAASIGPVSVGDSALRMSVPQRGRGIGLVAAAIGGVVVLAGVGAVVGLSGQRGETASRQAASASVALVALTVQVETAPKMEPVGKVPVVPAGTTPEATEQRAGEADAGSGVAAPAATSTPRTAQSAQKVGAKPPAGQTGTRPAGMSGTKCKPSFLVRCK